MLDNPHSPGNSLSNYKILLILLEYVGIFVSLDIMGDQRLNIHCPCSALELVMYRRDEIGSRYMRIGDIINNDDVVLFVVLYLL